LPKGEKLYTGAGVKLESTSKVNTRFIKSTAEEALRPKPNKSYFGIRPKLWLFMLAGDNPKNKFAKWLKKKGEAPVLLSSVKPGVTSAIIDAKLFNIGIFKSFTESKIIEKRYTAWVSYTSHIHKPYLVKELVCSIQDVDLNRLILSANQESFIKPGHDYNLAILKNERLRLDAFVKDHGYFYFNADYLLFKADTSEMNHDVTLKLILKDTIPANALQVYRIRNVIVDQDYSLNEELTGEKKDTLIIGNTVFLSGESEMEITSQEILRSAYLRKNELFSRKNHIITLNRLMSLDNFKFVRVKFGDSDTTATGYLDVTILMTPMPKRTFRAEVDMVSKSNDNAGPRLNVALLTRNVFKGAELLNLNMAGSFEAQMSGMNKNVWSYLWNPKVELTFPRFIVPFNLTRTGSINVPKTNISLSYNYLKRVNYFDMQTFQFQYGYKWREDIRKEHELNPVSVSYATIQNKSVVFNELLNSNPFLKKSYEEQFIAGGNYSFTYNEQVIPGKKIQYYFHLSTELAGNVFSLAKLISGGKLSSDLPSTIVGSVYSQFAKFSIDGRGYYNFKDHSKLAYRIFAGVAKPFGNSSVLPYSRQFFSGGPNSLRAFQINSVGPGLYFQNPENSGFLQLGGDLKLEMNSEYRFPVYRFLKGALFVDAGNTWLLKSNPENIGTPFSFSTFSNELAVGTGFGFRVDISFFVLRFDLAMPLRKPWLEKNHRWVINEINFGKSTWRGENLILNVAIGYPF
jgi:outer membrane protein assembly factor BamA